MGGKILDMSGHSKWSTIKHKKAARDQVRGNVFTKMASAITVAVKKGGSADPERNFSLRLAIDKAKAVNMPSSNIERAVQRASGQAEGQVFEELVLEGYGPGGVGIIIETVTDKHNRTVAEIKNILESAGGRLGEPGSVMYHFDKVGWITIVGVLTEERLLEVIDQGAIDVQNDEEQTRLSVKHDQVQMMIQKLKEWGYGVLEVAMGYQPKLRQEPVTTQELSELMEQLRDQDDVQEVFTV